MVGGRKFQRRRGQRSYRKGNRVGQDKDKGEYGRCSPHANQSAMVRKADCRKKTEPTAEGGRVGDGDLDLGGAVLRSPVTCAPGNTVAGLGYGRPDCNGYKAGRKREGR
jgi:hypothetical protein